MMRIPDVESGSKMSIVKRFKSDFSRNFTPDRFNSLSIPYSHMNCTNPFFESLK